MKKIFLALALMLLGTGIASAQTTFYFPQFVDGSQNPNGNVGWVSAMAITNTAAAGTPAASGSITLTQDDGTPMNITLVDENLLPTSNSFQLAGGQTKFFLSPQIAAGRLLQFSSGFVTVTSSLPVTGGLVFFEANGAGTFATAGVPGATAMTKQGSIVVVSQTGNPNSAQNVGIAVANPATSSTTIMFQLVDKTGAQVVPSVSRNVAAGNHTAFFITDLFPGAPASLYGSLRMTSTQPIAATALLFQGPTFGAIPIYPLQ